MVGTAFGNENPAAVVKAVKCRRSLYRLFKIALIPGKKYRKGGKGYIPRRDFIDLLKSLGIGYDNFRLIFK